MEKTVERRFEALSRLCLNNWHYIDRKVLSFHEGINFFTGHSGSGKSTVIDALQLLLYANTDGRAFFNKAATDDSDRSLMEYLRGMVSIDEENQYTYLRNKNFSTTIVMELMRTDTGEKQCVGVVFDVSIASNDIYKSFFWHRGEFLPNDYRTDERTMTVEEVKDYVRGHFSPDSYYFEGTNERFRAKLYDVYLGGLNAERFPQLFKRAIPFKMNMKLPDFVKEYICMERKIHVEDMQESVTQYARMCRQIQDIQAEVKELEEIEEAYEEYLSKKEETQKWKYFEGDLELLELKEKEREYRIRIQNHREDQEKQEKQKRETEQEIEKKEQNRDECIGRINSSGYENLKDNLKDVQQLLQRYTVNKGNLIRTGERLKGWEEEEITPNQVLWRIEKFQRGTIAKEELKSLKDDLAEIRRDVQKQKSDAESDWKKISAEKRDLQTDLKELKQGKAAYPKDLEEARKRIQEGIKSRIGKVVKVDILADLLEIRDETWRDAVEGYMGNHKLSLMVEPQYAKIAMEVYRTLDKKKYFTVSVLDTERVSAQKWEVREKALAEEVLCEVSYARAYVDYLMGRVIKCESIEELRRNPVGITSSCELYSGFRFQHINPSAYTRFAYIGEMSRKQRMRILEARIAELEERMKPFERLREEADRVLGLEYLASDENIYLGWLSDAKAMAGVEKKRKKLEEQIQELMAENVEDWKEEKRRLEGCLKNLNSQRDQMVGFIRDAISAIEREEEEYLCISQQLIEKERDFSISEKWEEEFQKFLKEKKEKNSVFYSKQRRMVQEKIGCAQMEEEGALTDLRRRRVEYLMKRPNRSFDSESLSNEEFSRLLEKLRVKDLDVLYEKAEEQAKDAIDIFKNDFIYKVRSAIKDAFEQRNQLNRIISHMEFGKDRYRFVVEKNKGADGRFYAVFMDENLEIKPSALTKNMENQMDLFTMSHEEEYKERISELLKIFIPPFNATVAEMEEAKKNMQKYADYRTYLSFDMEQIVKNEESQINIKLGRMIQKNSGGEGQNPRYIALLASFVQAYRIDLSPKLKRNPTIRLVVLDEAFSKMDAEKVAGCIDLMRQFGFQAIICSTNDKIQSYLDSVDKTFVFANPNKEHISIQEFEKKEYQGLRDSLEELEGESPKTKKTAAEGGEKLPNVD